MLPPIDGELSRLLQESDQMMEYLTKKSDSNFAWDEVENSKEFKVLQNHFNNFVKNKGYEKTSEGKKFEEIRVVVQKFDEDLNRIKGESKDNKIGRYSLIRVINNVYSAFGELNDKYTPEATGLQEAPNQAQSEKQNRFIELFQKYHKSSKEDDIKAMEKFFKANNINLDDPDFNVALMDLKQNSKISKEMFYFLARAGYDINFIIGEVRNAVELVKYCISHNISIQNAKVLIPWEGCTVNDIQFLVRNGIKFDPHFIIITIYSDIKSKVELLRELIFFGYISDPALKKQALERVPETAQYFKIRDEVLEGLQLSEKILPVIVAMDIFKGSQTLDIGRIIAKQAGTPNSLELHELCADRLKTIRNGILKSRL